METHYVLVVAGGAGRRIGSNVPKQLIPLLGRPVLARTLDAFLNWNADCRICVTLHPSILDEWNSLAAEWFPGKEASRIFTAAGGAERLHSVHAGLQAIEKDGHANDLHNPWVSIHDGVRPFVTKPLLDNACRAAEKHGNAVAAVPVKSSLRKILPDGNSEAVDRSSYFHVQTPQVFRLAEILSCYENRPHDHFTDDASLAEHFGIQVHLCEGSYDNLKITTPEDILLAEILLKHPDVPR